MKTETIDPFTLLEPLSEIVCNKCGHHNPGDAASCQNCERHLLIYCAHCGHPNYRGTSRCVECRTQLHISRPRQWKPARARTWVKPLAAILFVVAVSVTARGVFKLANLDLPKREPVPPSVYVLKPDGTWYQK
ncbi:MAG: hypothetical protein HYY23_18480 [Verrucomicrobia bacterium]|nr:hypothetical protein [Verrucomicrobiota bacterium]